jgi:hypothetical protein
VKLLWLDLKYYPIACLEELRKIIKNLSQDSRHPRQDSKEAPSKYESGSLLNYFLVGYFKMLSVAGLHNIEG